MKLFFIFSVVMISFCSVVIVKQIAIERSGLTLQAQTNKIDFMVSKLYGEKYTMIVDKYYIKSKVKNKKLKRLEELLFIKINGE